MTESLSEYFDIMQINQTLNEINQLEKIDSHRDGNTAATILGL